MTTTLTPHDQLDASRLRAVAARPYLRKALWALQPREKPGMGTLGVDIQARLYWDPGVFKKWSIAQVGGVLLHEVAHILRAHAKRFAKHDDHLRANIAGDLEINGQPDKCGLCHELDRIPGGLDLPEEVLRTDKMEVPPGLLAEEYYQLIKNEQGGGGSDSPPSDDAPSSSGDASAPAAGNCGSAATGKRQPYEDAAPEDGGPSGLSESDLEALRRAVARDITEHQKTKGRGSVPAGWLRWAEEILEPRIPAQTILGAAVRHAMAHIIGATDYTYRRPSRRQGAVQDDIRLPGLHQPVPRIAIAVDTSGSMGDPDIGAGLGTIRSVLRTYGNRVRVTVIACDAKVAGRADVRTLGQVAAILRGGGGTRMEEAFKEVESLRPRPSVFILVTDCETSWPENPPVGVRKSIIVRTRPGQEAPAWAQVIDLKTK